MGVIEQRDELFNYFANAVLKPSKTPEYATAKKLAKDTSLPLSS